jgi:hypothetical protein
MRLELGTHSPVLCFLAEEGSFVCSGGAGEIGASCATVYNHL